MNKCFFSFCIVILNLCVYTRLYSQYDGMNGPSLSDLISIKNGAGAQKYSNIKGSPYANDSFKLGKVYTTKGTYNNVLLRFDLVNGWIEYKEKEKIMVISPEAIILQVDIDTNSFFTHPYFDGGRLKMAFFNLLHGSSQNTYAKLLKLNSVIFVEKPPAKALEMESEPAKFDPQPPKFFVRFEKQEAKPVLTIKKLLLLFPDHIEEIESYAKKNKLGMNAPDLIKLISYYNQFKNPKS